MAEFQSFARSPEFNPVTIASPTAALERRNQQALQDLQTYTNQIARRDQQLIEDTRFKGKGLEAFAEFSGTALKITQDILKQTKEDKDIGALTDSQLYDPVDASAESQTESALIEQGLKEQAVFGQAVNQLSAQGQPAAAEILAERAKIGKGVANETAFLKNLRAILPAQVSELLADDTSTANYRVTGTDGETITGNLYVLSRDPKTSYGAVKLALQIALKKNGAQYATKRNYAEILGGTVEQILSNTSANLIATSISNKQKDRAITISNSGALIGTALADVVKNNQIVNQQATQTEFDKAYNSALVMNSGLSPGQINQEIIRGMMLGAGSNVGIVKNTIANIETSPGNTVANTYPQLLAEGIQQAERLNQQERQTQAEDLAAKGLQEIQRMQESGASIQDINRRKGQIASQLSGLNINVATAFNGQIDNLVLEPMQETKEQQLTQQILSGRTFTPIELQQTGLSSAKISSLQNLQNDNGTFNLISDVIQTQERNIRAAALQGAGVKLDATNQYITQAGWLQGSTVETALQRLNTDAQRHMLRYAQSLRGLNPDQQQQAMEREYRLFMSQELKPGGSYQALGELVNSVGKTLTEQEKSRLKESMRQYASPNAMINRKPVRGISVDLSGQVNYGQQLPQGAVSQWKKGGGLDSTIELASYNETVIGVDTYKKTGTIQQGFKTWATQLGINPVEFLKHQANRYSIDMPDSFKPKTPSVLDNIKPGPNLTRQQQQAIQPAVVRSLNTEYGLTDKASKALSYVFMQIPKSQWKIFIQDFPSYKKFYNIVNNPNSTEKQIQSAYQEFQVLYNKQNNLR